MKAARLFSHGGKVVGPAVNILDLYRLFVRPSMSSCGMFLLVIIRALKNNCLYALLSWVGGPFIEMLNIVSSCERPFRPYVM